MLFICALITFFLFLLRLLFVHDLHWLAVCSPLLALGLFALIILLIAYLTRGLR